MSHLQEILLARDRRAARQAALLGMNRGTLLCLTVQLPGPVKRDSRTLMIASAAVKAVRESFEVIQEELLDLETGYEACFLVQTSSREAKFKAVALEENHPLGRLFDLDVLVLRGSVPYPLSREELGLEPRRCLICDKPARECMRSKAHTTAALLEKIDRICSR